MSVNTHAASSAGVLTIDFVGEVHEISPGHEFTFGRMADLEVDENPYMHRTVGKFVDRHDRWWLVNIGSSIAIELYDRDSRSSAKIMPGTEQALPGSDMVVRFTAGATTYEIDITTEADSQFEIEESTDTMALSDLPMTDSQLQLILALAEQKLREPQAPLVVPASKEAATRLGWSITKFNRKLDNVCEKLTKAGVTGLKSSASSLNTDRRRHLVEYGITSGLIDSSMLPLLDEE